VLLEFLVGAPLDPFNLDPEDREEFEKVYTKEQQKDLKNAFTEKRRFEWGGHLLSQIGEHPISHWVKFVEILEKGGQVPKLVVQLFRHLTEVQYTIPNSGGETLVADRNFTNNSGKVVENTGVFERLMRIAQPLSASGDELLSSKLEEWGADPKFADVNDGTVVSHEKVQKAVVCALELKYVDARTGTCTEKAPVESDFQSAKIRKSAKNINKQNAVAKRQPEKESEAPPAAPEKESEAPGRRTRAHR
jgi:hypothetical protein